MIAAKISKNKNCPLIGQFRLKTKYKIFERILENKKDSLLLCRIYTVKY